MDLNSVNITATQVAKNYFSASKLATVLCNLPKCTVGVTPVLNNPTTSTPTVSSKD